MPHDSCFITSISESARVDMESPQLPLLCSSTNLPLRVLPALSGHSHKQLSFDLFIGTLKCSCSLSPSFRKRKFCVVKGCIKVCSFSHCSCLMSSGFVSISPYIIFLHPTKKPSALAVVLTIDNLHCLVGIIPCLSRQLASRFLRLRLAPGKYFSPVHWAVVYSFIFASHSSSICWVLMICQALGIWKRSKWTLSWFV